MPILACILPVATFLCQPVLDAFQACVGNQARRFFDFLPNWAGDLFARCLGNPAEEVPESASEVVGAEETLSVIRSHLNDDSVGIIGIYGMGGVGKTTILQRINNEFFESGRQGSFDLVIWVTVSQTVSIPNIQKQIADRLGLSLSCSSTEEDARVLFKALSDKRFLVLLDDIWKAIDLQVEIGIPKPTGRRRNSKIAFTTRLLGVCIDMEADKSIPVKPLDKAASWELFSSKLRTQEVRTNPTIRLLAKQVADDCGGLPLALITVGRAMANRKLSRDWEDAVDALDYRPERLEGMDNQGKEALISELRKELRVSDVEHREILAKVKADNSIKTLRKLHKGAGGTLSSSPRHLPHVHPSLGAVASAMVMPKKQCLDVLVFVVALLALM